MLQYTPHPPVWKQFGFNEYNEPVNEFYQTEEDYLEEDLPEQDFTIYTEEKHYQDLADKQLSDYLIYKKNRWDGRREFRSSKVIWKASHKYKSMKSWDFQKSQATKFINKPLDEWAAHVAKLNNGKDDYLSKSNLISRYSWHKCIYWSKQPWGFSHVNHIDRVKNIYVDLDGIIRQSPSIKKPKRTHPITTPVYCKEVIVNVNKGVKLTTKRLISGEDAKAQYIEANMHYIQCKEKQHLAERDWSAEAIFNIHEKYNQERRELHNRKFHKFLEEDVYESVPDVEIHFIKLNGGTRYYVGKRDEHAEVTQPVDRKEFLALKSTCAKKARDIITSKEKEIKRLNEELEKKIIKLERERNLIKLQSHGFDEFSFKSNQRKTNKYE